MIGVAGAIVAQIAITALSLEYLEATHWTATAAFVISLIAGLLSVYYACILQQQMSSLHGPGEVERWLTTVRSKRPPLLDLKLEIGEPHRPTHKEYIMPSYNAALLLVLPSILLNWSSIALLIGIGIYYGIVHTQNLSSVRGINSSLAILLVYVLFTLGATISYMLPWLQKQLESTPPAQDELERVFRADPRNAAQLVPRSPRSGRVQPNLPDQSLRFDLLRTGGIQSLRHHVTMQDSSLGERDNAQVPIISPTQNSPSSQPQHEPWAAGNNLQVRFQAEIALPGSPGHALATTEAFVTALNASILAQKASLQAHELLRSELQKQEDLRTTARRASL